MTYDSTNSAINRIGFIGNYLPRQCGIATFTTDLCEAIATEYGETTCIALPVNNIATGYIYPSRVRFERSRFGVTRLAGRLAARTGRPVCTCGFNGFYQQDREQARFDQQPVEAQTMVSACLEIAVRETNVGVPKPSALSSGF